MILVKEFKLVKRDETFNTLREYSVFVEMDGSDFLVRVSFGLHKKERQSFYQIINKSVPFSSENREAAIRTKYPQEAWTFAKQIVEYKKTRQGWLEVTEEDED